MAASSRKGTYFLPGLALVFGVIGADQYSKWLIMDGVLRPPGVARQSFWHWFVTVKKIGLFVILREHFRSVALAPFLNLVMVWNQGVSFGMFNTQEPKMALVFIGVSLAVSALMLVWLAMSAEAPVAAALSLIVGGALGNAIDRLRFDAVADFIDFHVRQYHWPAFNVADSCIVAGAGILMLGAFLGDTGARRTK
ncbi:MAG: signal peptidase II [Alphaproteobacteria bacterium]|nr:signal peptidase II [Alphaproteobacteria bacterium]